MIAPLTGRTQHPGPIRGPKLFHQSAALGVSWQVLTHTPPRCLRQSKHLILSPAPSLDSGAKRNGLSEADFYVLAKLGKNGLERGLEAEAFSWGQVCGEDDFLNVLVGELIDIELARQP